jgi:predicted amidophosphoribosyltransferase
VPRAEDYTDPYLSTYTAPLPTGVGSCDICHGVPNPGYSRCWSCEQSASSVSQPVEVVVPISLYRVGKQLHSVLRGYKSSPDPRARARYRLRVAATLHRFVRDHRSCIEQATGQSWDVVTIVPSKQSRDDEHPMEEVLGLGRDLGDQYRQLLRADQPATGGRVHGGDRWFRAIEDVSELRVLLVDDTFTSGASMQSAASALSLAGAVVVAALPVGRVITTDDPRYPHRDEIWAQRRDLGFSFSRCCLEPD